MTWAYLDSGGKAMIASVPTRMNSEGFQDVLQANMLLFLADRPDTKAMKC